MTADDFIRKVHVGSYSQSLADPALSYSALSGRKAVTGWWPRNMLVTPREFVCRCRVGGRRIRWSPPVMLFALTRWVTEPGGTAGPILLESLADYPGFATRLDAAHQ